LRVDINHQVHDFTAAFVDTVEDAVKKCICHVCWCSVSKTRLSPILVGCRCSVTTFYWSMLGSAEWHQSPGRCE